MRSWEQITGLSHLREVNADSNIVGNNSTKSWHVCQSKGSFTCRHCDVMSWNFSFFNPSSKTKWSLNSTSVARLSATKLNFRAKVHENCTTVEWCNFRAPWLSLGASKYLFEFSNSKWFTSNNIASTCWKMSGRKFMGRLIRTTSGYVCAQIASMWPQTTFVCK